jgi:uncharacterized membrane protein
MNDNKWVHYGMHATTISLFSYLTYIAFQDKRKTCPEKSRWVPNLAMAGIGSGLLLFVTGYLLTLTSQQRFRLQDPMTLSSLWLMVVGFYFLYEAIQMVRSKSLLCKEGSDGTIRFLYIAMLVTSVIMVAFASYYQNNSGYGYSTTSGEFDTGYTESPQF